MKKLSIALLMAAFTAGLFADDAIVMPEGVFRARLTNSYAFYDEAYNDDGEAKDSTEVSMDLLGAAFEMGMTKELTLGLQWAPAAVVWSDVDINDATLTGQLDQLFVGVKAQIVGEQGYVPNDKIRFAVSPGIKIPLQKYDVESELESALDGDEFTVTSFDNEALGLGGRLSLDYIVNDEFYVNVYSEIIYNLPVEKNLDAQSAAAIYESAMGDLMPYILNGTYTLEEAEAIAMKAATDDYEYEYGMDFLIEVDPHYEMMVSEKDSVKFNLPVRYTVSPEVQVEGEKVVDSGYLLTMAPQVAFFSASGVMPWEVSLDYSLPLAGQNASKSNSVTLQVKLYGRIF